MAVGEWTGTTSLIPGYRHSKRLLEIKREQLKEQHSIGEEWQLELLDDMISDCNFVISRLISGRIPFYERKNSSWEPDWINTYYSSNSNRIVDRSDNEGLTAEQKARIQKALNGLSRREQQCYMMHMVDGMSLGSIGLELHLGKSTVQTNIERAQKKIELNKGSSLFLVE
mgnify:CR=1 FL=1